jgi:hypothetical protein
MEIPWADLPATAPYVLPADRDRILAFNNRPGRLPHHRLQLHVLPEPYIGRVDAPIVLLKLNPRYDRDDARFAEDPRCREVWLRNALHQPLDYPFYPLDPFLAWTASARWWRRRLGRLIDRFGERVVAENLLCIESFPYRAAGSWIFKGVLASQQYSFRLAERAMERDALILMANRESAWYRAVPALEGYPRLHTAKVKHGGYVTPGFYPEGLPEVERILRDLDTTGR